MPSRVFKLEVSEVGLARLEDLSQMLGTSSSSEATRKSLNMVWAIARELKDGGELCVVKGNELMKLKFEGFNPSAVDWEKVA